MERMLDAIRREARQTAVYTGHAEISEPVMQALAAVPRSAFVPEGARGYAYENVPLAIGHGQTISQPFIVALMTDLLSVAPQHRVLEIGTGSGYQAAVLGALAARVYSVEVVPELAEAAAARLAALGHDNVRVRTGDGWYGWPEAAPFQGILVAAVGEAVSPELVSQLAVGGRLVLPLGAPHGRQMLTVIEKDADGALDRRDVLPVQFVPFTGEH
ncbi:MAG: protein-L-isoaspartate(D-aspartate) O-methyltransferase [Pseudomonadota bacterium]